MRATPKHNLDGQQFGKWLVLSFDGFKKNKGASWLCKCSCGVEKSIAAGELLRNRTSSCHQCAMNEFSKTHGMTDTLEYKTWCSMRARCYLPSNPSYSHYGGRGITVCERWLGEDGFQNFYADLGPKPYPEYSLERKDNNQGYNPDNCKWATILEQNRNKTSYNRYLEYEGKSLCIGEWSEIKGIRPDTIWCRLKAGWSIEKTLNTKSRKWVRAS